MKYFLRDLYERLRNSGLVLRLGPFYNTKSVDELPDRLKDRTLYLIGSSKPWSVALLCPCGCGETIQLSLLHDDSPSWRLYQESKKRASLEPSIWRTEGCGSHFFLKRGRIIWCHARRRVR
jgi:hypothetical protein